MREATRPELPVAIGARVSWRRRQRGASYVEVLILVGAVVLALLGAFRALQSSYAETVERQADAVRALGGVDGDALPEPPPPEPPPPEPPPEQEDDDGGFWGTVGAIALDLTPIGDIKTLLDPNASALDKALAAGGLAATFVPGGQAIKLGLAAAKVAKGADKAADAVDAARDVERAADKPADGAEGVGGAGKRDGDGDGDAAEELDETAAQSEGIPPSGPRRRTRTDTPHPPGSPEHKAQRWLDYQADHPERFPNPSDAMDPTWSKQYDQIIANKRAGGAFERGALDRLGLPKNDALMLRPDADGGGFIPDAVRGNPATLEWGKPYDFVEVKGWNNMSKTGNLAKMIDYVREHGGSVTVVFKKEPRTKLTGPLQRELDALESQGKAKILYQ